MMRRFADVFIYLFIFLKFYIWRVLLWFKTLSFFLASVREYFNCVCVHVRAQIVIIIRWMGGGENHIRPRAARPTTRRGWIWFRRLITSNQPCTYVERGVLYPGVAMAIFGVFFSFFSSDYANNNLSKEIDSSEFLICVDHSSFRCPQGNHGNELKNYIKISCRFSSSFFPCNWSVVNPDIIYFRK
jgi:hypothetical protein